MSHRIMFIIGLIMFAFSDVFADKEHVSLKLSFVNVPQLFVEIEDIRERGQSTAGRLPYLRLRAFVAHLPGRRLSVESK